MIRQHIVALAASTAFQLAFAPQAAYGDPVEAERGTENLSFAVQAGNGGDLLLPTVTALPCRLTRRCAEEDGRRRAQMALALLYLGIRSDCITQSCRVRVKSAAQ